MNKILILTLLLTACGQESNSSFTGNSQTLCGINFISINGQTTVDGQNIANGVYQTPNGCSYTVTNGQVTPTFQKGYR